MLAHVHIFKCDLVRKKKDFSCIKIKQILYIAIVSLNVSPFCGWNIVVLTVHEPAEVQSFSSLWVALTTPGTHRQQQQKNPQKTKN